MTSKHESALLFRPLGPFSMEPIRTMACGFLRGTRTCTTDGVVRLAFPEERTFNIVGVALRQHGEQLTASVTGAQALPVVRRQIERMLGIDEGARPYARILAADRVLAAISSRRPGFRPVVASSAYAMACWCVISQRLAMAQAAKLQLAIAEAHGDVITVDGERVGSCPRPETWLALPSFPGFPAEKLRRLQGIAEEALAGQLDTERLRSLPYAEAQAQLLAIHGVGPWSADGILVRGCGLTDAMAMSEPRVFDAVGRAYALGRPTTAEEVHALSESWRPFRTWITVLLVCEHFDAATNARSRSARRSGASRPSADSATSP